MKVSELMIGDWVLTLNSTHKEKVFAQVDAIEEGQHSILVTRECSNWFVDIDWIEPIPLIPEILEKNGFKKDKYGQMVLDEELGTSEIYIVLQDGVECYWWVVNGELIAKIRYVHQLQHTLRLCGIEKEIEL